MLPPLRRVYVIILLCISLGCGSAVTWAPAHAATSEDLISVWCTSTGYVYAVDAAGDVHGLRGRGARLPWDHGGPIAQSGDRMYQAVDGGLRVSSDGGQTWTPVAAGAPTDVSYGRAHILSVAVGSELGHVFALGRYLAISNSLESDYAYLVRSEDGGTTWDLAWTGPDQGPIGIGSRSGRDVASSLAVLPDGTVVIAAALDGSVLVSTDAGRSFTPRETPATAPLADLWLSPGGVLYGVGRDGQIVVSSDDGETFRTAPSGVSRDLTDIGGCGGEVWIVGAQGTVLFRGPE